MLHYVYTFTLFTVSSVIQEQACHAGRLPYTAGSAQSFIASDVSSIALSITFHYHNAEIFCVPKKGECEGDLRASQL